jgi:K+ transporter
MARLTALQSTATTVPAPPSPQAPAPPSRHAPAPPPARSLNEAAHKLKAPAHVGAKAEKPPPREFDTERDVVAHAGRAVLVLGALGVVYGDIGTSPLYTEQVIFTSHANAAHPVVAGVFGVVSLIFWALMIVVTIKYAGFIMRAHNRGDGGIMALTALVQRNRVAAGAALVTLGIFGAALFFGDGIITPAISVLGSLQGMQVATPALAHMVVT